MIFFFKQKTAYEIGLGIPAEPLFRSGRHQKLIRLFLLVLILLLMPTLNFLPVWFALSLLRFRLPSRRSEERRVGKECRSGWSRFWLKKNECYGGWIWLLEYRSVSISS